MIDAVAVATITILAVISPGADFAMVTRNSMMRSRRAGMLTSVGISLGVLVHVAYSMAGIGLLISRSILLFSAIKFAGAAYLIWLGIKLWRAPATIGAEGEAPAEERPFRIFAHAYVVTALNPKSIVFFVAFLPQFLDLSRPVLPQMVIFEITFLVLATLNAFSYALLASAARKTIRKPSVQKVVNRTGGTLLIGAGLITAGLKRATT